MKNIVLGMMLLGSLSLMAQEPCKISQENLNQIKESLGYDSENLQNSPAIIKSWMDLQYALSDSNIQIVDNGEQANIEFRENLYGNLRGTFSYKASVFPVGEERVSYRNIDSVLKAKTRDIDTSSKDQVVINSTIVSLFTDLYVCH